MHVSAQQTKDHPPAQLRPAARTPGAAADTPTGAQALVRSLELVGTTVVFGIPGGAILPAYDPLMDSTEIRHILVRHEQGAGHAAVGYAQATGRVGVCMATSGPGATNLVTAITDAYMDSVALVAVTGQVASTSMGTDAFQEADIVGITMPVTKHSYLVNRVEDIPRTIAEAFHLASTGRPGPVLVDITKDALQARAAFAWPAKVALAGYRPVVEPHQGAIAAAAELIVRAERPVLYIGGGVAKADAGAELLELAELVGAPVTTTLMALGTFPDRHALHVGMPGMHGSVAAVAALQQADLLVAVGTRFDDRVTGRLDGFAPRAKVVHADIDPAEIGKNRRADVPIVGDARHVLASLARAVREEHGRGRRGDYRAWWRDVARWRETYRLGYEQPPDGTLAPQQVVQRIGQLAPADTVFASGVGQHQMWAAHFLPHALPRRWLNSGGAGTMGYAVPAAMGAKVGRPKATVWAIDGDGCFQMTNQELVTCALNDIPIKVAVINNGVLGMVRQWQTLFYSQRYSQTALHGGPPAGTGGGTRVPDFVKLAEAMGCVGLRCERPQDLDAVITAANGVRDRPVVVDFVVHQDALVWPMVAAGASNDEIEFARGLRPSL